MGVLQQERPDEGTADEYGVFIAGSFREPASGEYFDIENPYTHEVWARAPRGAAADVAAAVSAARSTFESDEWQSTLPMQRANLLDEMADVAEEHATELGELSVQENGRTITDMHAEALGMVRWLRYYASLCDSELEGRTVPVENKGGALHTEGQ
jgi:aldehyde dehydrogenase (NAD+)